MNLRLFRPSRITTFVTFWVLAVGHVSAAPTTNFTLVSSVSQILTPADMLSYRVSGKRNPTLNFRKASTLKILFVNTDDDMFHDIRFG